jgi:hypothetical protein
MLHNYTFVLKLLEHLIADFNMSFFLEGTGRSNEREF